MLTCAANRPMKLKIQHSCRAVTRLLYTNTVCTGLTLLISLIILTPLCGWLFACGCTWPGLGLDANCNFHQPHALHQCPWCASTVAGWGSVIIALAAGVVVPLASVVTRQKSVAYKVLLGVLVFVAVAILTGFLAAVTQGYPL